MDSPWWTHLSSLLSSLGETLVPISPQSGAVAGAETELRQSMTEKKVCFHEKMRLRDRKN